MTPFFHVTSRRDRDFIVSSISDANILEAKNWFMNNSENLLRIFPPFELEIQQREQVDIKQ